MNDKPSMTYGQYLGLPQLLSAQHPISDHHDELLFVIIHQTKELWLKQVIHELKLARELVRADALVPVHKNLSRVSRIQAVMTLSWDVLATLTPTDYTSFRHVLGSSSGFQSAQFRQVEYLLGLKDAGHLRFQEEGSAEHEALGAALRSPSLWDEANAALARAGFDLPAAVLDRDWSEPYQPSPEVEAAWATVYRDAKRWWPLYQLAEKLVDVDDAMATWRHKHVITVERVIGFKRGTGGTAGVSYLQSTLGKRAFPELWTLRTAL
ncbi:tryptophan 2,3-dioxygenase [Sphingosinicella sp. LY1275]|uniref:tryptophan 2,3-dioxygenase n=1 Tax=Sphingosinicella sp. LY1275 TaxID=3095379 RepID=UPI002ADEC7E6|nr:tryptophan 2,3-dioxygenase family protein [Sphingosinicella sp. LY1275]MEA1014465.1 tryptophan 2,3-dioxygenase family protein [Sphingosinicella sp. LY1275]